MKSKFIFSEVEITIIYFSLCKEIQRKRKLLKLVENPLILNLLAREVLKLEKLKTKVLKLKNN